MNWGKEKSTAKTTNIQHPTSNNQWLEACQHNWMLVVGCWLLDVPSSPSRHSFPLTESPLRHKAAQHQQKHHRLVPQWFRPRFRDRRVAFGKMTDHFFHIVHRHDCS